MPCTVVVGAQWGDEGKGKIVDALSAEADIVARYQGGPNAGHSVVRDGRTVVLHLVPSGVMHPGKRCLIGNGVVIDLARLGEEVERLELMGLEVRSRLGVSPAAHLILPYHRAAEASAEQGPGAIGTTGRAQPCVCGTTSRRSQPGGRMKRVRIFRASTSPGSIARSRMSTGASSIAS